MKKGIELSLNFLITVIIAIVILFFGIRFISDLVVETSKLESLTLNQIDNKIENLLCEAEKVCIGITKKTIQKGKFDVFGIRIINVISDDEFSDEFNVNIKVSKLIKNNNEIIDPDNLNKIKLKYRTNNFIIEKNNEENIGIGVEVAKEAVSGTYILDVIIPQYDEVYKIYVEVP